VRSRLLVQARGNIHGAGGRAEWPHSFCPGQDSHFGFFKLLFYGGMGRGGCVSRSERAGSAMDEKSNNYT
jgi:hypothetical protein